MKKSVKKACLFFAGLVLLAIAFAAGIECGHRYGYDLGWSECKFDAKETLFQMKDETFWQWQGSRQSCIRKHRSFWFQ